MDGPIIERVALGLGFVVFVLAWVTVLGHIPALGGTKVTLLGCWLPLGIVVVPMIQGADGHKRIAAACFSIAISVVLIAAQLS